MSAQYDDTALPVSRRWDLTHGQRLLLVWAITSFTVAMIGPFGSFDRMPLFERFLYWSTVVSSAIVVAGAIHHLIYHKLGLSGVRADLLGNVVMGLVYGTMLWAMNSYFGHLTGVEIVSWLVHVTCVFNIGMVIVAVRMLLLRGAVQKPEPAQNVRPFAGPMIQKIASEIGTNVHYAGADGHYIEIETDRGSARVLMRFSDGVEELSRMDGVRVHRSHWVARRAIDRIEQDGRRKVLVMTSGRRVPISRSYEDSLLPMAEGA